MESSGTQSRALDARLARTMARLGEAFDEETFTVPEARSVGVGHGTLARLVAVGALVRVARGLYVAPRAEHAWIDRLRGLLESRPGVAACSVTAAQLTVVAIPPEPVTRAALATPSAGWTTEPDLVHLCGIEGFDVPHWRMPGVRFVRTSVPASHVVEVRSGIRVTDPIRTGLDLARGRDLACALVPLDSVLRRLLRAGFPLAVARSLVSERCDRMISYPGVRALRRAVGFMHPGAETALESLVRGRLIDAGIEGIRVQLVVTGASGREYRVDLAVEKSPGIYLIIEADGLGKYAESTDLAKEKVRQHDLESRGHGVVRVMYREAAYAPSAFIERVRAALAG